jgi:hypothetical protein
MNKPLMLVLAVAVLTTVSGCGHSPDPDLNQVDNAAVSYVPPQTTAPSPSHLVALTRRISVVQNLPITQAVDQAGNARTISAQAVLFIDPSQAYAINQFNQIWDKISPRPAVVWMHTTPRIAANTWKAEGYSGDPLPSNVTLYTDRSVPTPDLYRANGATWFEIPGLVSPTDVEQLASFLGHQPTHG